MGCTDSVPDNYTPLETLATNPKPIDVEVEFCQA